MTPKLALHTRPRKHMQNVYQNNLISVLPPIKQQPAKKHLLNSRKKLKIEEHNVKPCSTSSEIVTETRKR